MAWRRSVAVQLPANMSVHFSGRESRLSLGPKRPPRNHRPPLTCNEASSALHIALDDRLQSATGIAPLPCHGLETIDDRCDLTPAGAGAFSIHCNDRVAETQTIDRARQIGSDDWPSSKDRASKNTKATKGRIETGDTAHGKMGPHRPCRHNRA